LLLFLLQGAAMVGRCSWLALLAMPSTNSLGPGYGDGGKDMTDVKPTRQRTMAAARMRLSRLRRHGGMRVIPFEVRDGEIEGLVAHGLLDPAQRNDREAIARALGNLIDRIPLSWWRVAARAGDRANYPDRCAR
jgi:hypothetical protein